MENRAITRELKKTQTTVHEIENTDSELYKVGMYTTAAFAIAVGAWGLVCLSSAVLEIGAPLEILTSL